MKLILNEEIAFKNPKWNVDFHIWNQMNTMPHSHTFYEIFIVTKGVLHHTVNGTDELLSVGDMRLINPEDNHYQFSDKANTATTLNFSFSKDYLSNCGFGDENILLLLSSREFSNLYHLSNSELNYIVHLADSIATSLSQNDEVRKIKIMILFLIDYFISYHKDFSDETVPECFLKFVRLINDPRYFTLSVSDLCKKINYTPSAMSAIFKKYSGETIIKYITDVKINYACNILKNTNYSITTLTSILGYDSISHFDHIFKNKVGVTPKQFKKNTSSANDYTYPHINPQR